ncbi:hypothetical protein LCGC14_2449190 [marine sediment metagenome]|uniref:Uncharacterized protein n=1 Tax=marine sediment metagenome TaxID=412755 RepID=A0A0F9BGY9_9ZZZZ
MTRFEWPQFSPGGPDSDTATYLLAANGDEARERGLEILDELEDFHLVSALKTLRTLLRSQRKELESRI